MTPPPGDDVDKSKRKAFFKEEKDWKLFGC
jgi:hypothetical protein